jgi:hypothetical protein
MEMRREEAGHRARIIARDLAFPWFSALHGPAPPCRSEGSFAPRAQASCNAHVCLMTDSKNGAAAPPKKRTFGFKKAAWQTAPQNDGQDMFSHSSEFQEVVAEETKRQHERKEAEEAQKRKMEEAQKREAKEARERKRRKVSIEQDEGVPARSSPQSREVARKRCVYCGSVRDAARLTNEQAQQHAHVSRAPRLDL